MLRFSESLSLAVPPFFRKILVDLSQADEALLKIVDDHWKAGQIPDLLFLIKHISPGDPDDVIPDLMVMDMEWRWKSSQQENRWDLRQYDALLKQPLSSLIRARILCREFGIRNRWGDCIGRKEICDRHPDLRELFLLHVEKEIRDIAEWPIISIVVNGEEIASKQLDRVITAGRQAFSAQTPWTIQTFDFSHHLVLCEMRNPSLSREQLEIRLCADRMISVSNTSRSRAVAIRSSNVAIDAGQSQLCSLAKPIRIHLFGGYDLMIHGQS